MAQRNLHLVTLAFPALRYLLPTTEQDRSNLALISRVAARLQALARARMEHLLIHTALPGQPRFMVPHQRTEVQIILPAVLLEVPDLFMELFLMVHVLMLKIIGLEDSRQAADLGPVENPRTEVESPPTDILRTVAEFCLASNLKERGLPDSLQVELGLASNLGTERGQEQARYNLDMGADPDVQEEIAEVPLVRKKIAIAEDVAGIAIVAEGAMYQRMDCAVEQQASIKHIIPLELATGMFQILDRIHILIPEFVILKVWDWYVYIKFINYKFHYH